MPIDNLEFHAKILIVTSNKGENMTKEKEKKLKLIESKLKSIINNEGISLTFIEYMIKIHLLGDKAANVFNNIQNYVISTKNAEYIYDFARSIKGANIQKLEDAIIRSKNAKYIYVFARSIEGANIQKLEDAIIKTKNVKYIEEFAEYVKGANKERLYAVTKKLEENAKKIKRNNNKENIDYLISSLEEQSETSNLKIDNN